MPALNAPASVGTLAHLRIRAGLTQEDVASKLTTTQATVSRWESGSRPRRRRRDDLAGLYGVTLDELDEAITYTATLRSRDSAFPGYVCRLIQVTGDFVSPPRLSSVPAFT